jgi:nucleotide-binding universal stress UspA family protein
MFKHILVPTDGSPVSTKAAKAAIALAKESGARVTGYSAVEPVPARLYGEGYVVDRQDVAEFERRSREHAKKHVAAIERAARNAGVPFEPLVETARTPYHGIIQAAKKRHCDLIFMSSHGRTGLMRMALGSVADKVMTLSSVPVMVYR